MQVDLGSTWPAPDGLVRETGFAIYDHPLDYPEGFVVRRWWIFRGQTEPVADIVPRFAQSLQEARAWIPVGLTRMPRMHGDDLSICETWI